MNRLKTYNESIRDQMVGKSIEDVIDSQPKYKLNFKKLKELIDILPTFLDVNFKFDSYKNLCLGVDSGSEYADNLTYDITYQNPNYVLKRRGVVDFLSYTVKVKPHMTKNVDEIVNIIIDEFQKCAEENLQMNKEKLEKHNKVINNLNNYIKNFK